MLKFFLGKHPYKTTEKVDRPIEMMQQGRVNNTTQKVEGILESKKEDQDKAIERVSHILRKIWPEFIQQGIGVELQFPEIVTFDESFGIYPNNYYETIQKGANSIFFSPTNNTIFISSEIQSEMSRHLKNTTILERDIGWGLILGHELGHSIYRQIRQSGYHGKEVELFCDRIAGYTFKQMRILQLTSFGEYKDARDFFYAVGQKGNPHTHGTHDERELAFMEGSNMKKDQLLSILKSLIPLHLQKSQRPQESEIVFA